MDHHNHGSPSFINIAVLLLFAVVIAIASTATTYYFLNSKTTEQPPIIQPPVVLPVQTNIQPTNTINSVTINPTNGTENWKIYRDEKYGYEIKYPSQLLRLTVGASPQTGRPSVSFISYKKREIENSSFYSYGIEIEPSNNEDQSDDMYFTKQSEALSQSVDPVRWKIINFAGKKWIETDSGPGLFAGFNLYTPHNQYEYRITLSVFEGTTLDAHLSDPDSADGLRIFRQMLSTFKFTQ